MKFIVSILFAFLFLSCANQRTYSPLLSFDIPYELKMSEESKNIELKFNDIKLYESFSKDTSTEFKNTALYARLKTEINLLKDALQKESKKILEAKGYKIVDTNADYTAYQSLNIYLDEIQLAKDESLIDGNFIRSNLKVNLVYGLAIDFKRRKIPFRNIHTESKISGIELRYKVPDSKDLQGSNLKQSITELDEDIKLVVKDIDEFLIDFYRKSIKSLIDNL